MILLLGILVALFFVLLWSALEAFVIGGLLYLVFTALLSITTLSFWGWYLIALCALFIINLLFNKVSGKSGE